MRRFADVCRLCPLTAETKKMIDADALSRMKGADRDTREANPKYYWFHSFDGPPKFCWNELMVSEEEFRANGEEWQLELLAHAPSS